MVGFDNLWDVVDVTARRVWVLGQLVDFFGLGQSCYCVLNYWALSLLEDGAVKEILLLHTISRYGVNSFLECNSFLFFILFLGMIEFSLHLSLLMPSFSFMNLLLDDCLLLLFFLHQIILHFQNFLLNQVKFIC